MQENIAELAETLAKNSGSFSKKGKADLELISRPDNAVLADCGRIEGNRFC